jgi:hypothetical protein
MVHLNPKKLVLFGAACSPVTDQIAKAARHWNLVQVTISQHNCQIIFFHFAKINGEIENQKENFAFSTQIDQNFDNFKQKNICNQIPIHCFSLPMRTRIRCSPRKVFHTSFGSCQARTNSIHPGKLVRFLSKIWF